MDKYDKYYESVRKKKKKEEEEELEKWNRENPDKQIGEDRMPIAKTTKVTDEDRTWFLEGLFGDGYDFGDVARTIMGSADDASRGLIRGVLNAGEGILDAGTFVTGKAAETLGFDGFAEKAYKFQQRDLIEEVKEKSRNLDSILLGTPQELVKSTPKVIDNTTMSIFGDRSDSLIQSAGQLGATIGLQGAGVPWWLTTGTTAFGQSSTEAMKQGATSNEAAAYGAISAGSEIIFERLSGGIKFGGKALDDGLKKLIAEKISGKTLNTLARFGLDAAGEGVEEVLTEVATKVGEKLTFEDDKTWGELLTSEEAMDNYIESFIGGAVMGGGFNAGRVAKSLKTGRDYDTGFSDNEQTLINREVGRRTEELQKEAAVNAEVEKQISELSKTVNLSEAEKNNIKKRVREQLDNGELDFSTSKLSKKELAEIEEQVTEDLKKGYFDIDTIESTFAEAKTSRIRELIAERDNSSNEEKKAEIQKEIDQLTLEKNKEMQKFVTNDYWLQESYRQEVLKGESFTREAGRKDTDITKELEESAKAAGMNNTRKMHELFDYTNRIANDTDTKYGFINNKQLQSMGYAVKDATINGMVRVQEDGTTKVLINVDSGKALNTIIGHETTHLLEGTQEHQELIAAVKEYAQMKGDYDGRIKAVQELYKNVDTNIENEVTADLVGDYIFTDEQFVMNLAKKPNVFQKVYDYVKHAYKMATAGSAEARQLLKAKRSFKKAYKNMSLETQKDITAQTEPVAENRNESNFNKEGYSVFSEDIKFKENEESAQPVRIINNDVEEADPSMFEETPEEPILDYNDTTVPMDKESMRLLTKNMKEVLGLNRTQRSILKNVIKDYSTGKISTPDDLYNAIADQFGVQSYEYKNDEILTVKKALRETKVKVSDQVKDSIPDYFKFRQSNFGKIRFANDGMAIDDLYGALSEVYPGYFPADIVTQEDQLIRMAEVANLDSTIREEYILPDEKIAEATDFIRESVSEYKRGAKLKDSLKRRNADGTPTRKEIHANYMKKIKDTFTERGMDFDAVLSGAKNLSTFASVDNTPQRYMEKTFGYKEGQVLSDLTVNQAAENETAAIRWLNSFTNKKSGTLAELSRKYKIKPFSKEDAAAQKYAEGMYVNQYGDYVEYGDRQLEYEIKDPQMRANIKAFVRDPAIRKIYDETLDAINASRTRNGYPAIPRRNDYFLHFREMDDTFSRIGIPFNPNDIKAKDLPTDINGMTADNKPGQPYFASSMQRKGVGTTYSLLGGMEKYLTAAKPQIFHIDDIQILRALRNYTADTYGQAKGLESLDEMSDEEAEARIKQVYGAHLSTFAKFLNEEANIMAGKTALIDRGLEGIVGRRAITFMNTLNSQVAKNMIGFNLSSSLTNFVSVTQAAAKASKYDVIKAFSQTVSNKLKGIAGKSDGFAEKNSAIVRRKGQDKFYKKRWERWSDRGFIFMSAIDDVSTEFVVRTKYNELIRKGMSEDKAHDEAGKWAMRILGDRSFGQMPQIFNSKTLGLVTKFQLEVRNQLDSMFYDTVQEANLSTEEIQEGTKRNAVKAAKIASTVTQLAVFQHLFGKAFESVAGYNPTFDIIENLMILFGFDDEEDSEDTFTDNLEEALLGLGEDLPYFSAMTGGRIPIESALPIEQFVQGKDDYGNDKSRWETLGEALPYYFSPTGANQIKKTAQGLKMFDKDLPVAGSYTESGNLRFPVEPTPENVLQSLLFGQWANKNAREYFDGEHKPLKENQIQEYKELDIPIADYWKIREDMAKIPLNDKKVDYIDSLDLPLSKKNILVNNVLDRDEKVDMAGYGNYSSFEEFDFAVKNPDKYPMTKAVGGYEAYKKYSEELYEIKADKDEAGNSIRGTRKTKVIEYIEGMDADYGTKILLYKKEYPSDDSYNHDIIDYLNEREDISYAEMKTILESLDFTVDDEGNIWW